MATFVRQGPHRAAVKPLQHLVSQKKRRLIKDGFDLDLSYITDQIIAMGLPCTGKSAIYRNPQCEVIEFLERYHGGQYKVYNLCTRPKDLYDPEKFDGRVACFPFEDHGVPRLEHVHAFTTSVLDWVGPSRCRVVCIHCLAGKGRTGLMVCAALMRLGIKQSAREAMAFYGELRMKNKKGVTQASQRRWVEYYEQTLERSIDFGIKRTLLQVSLQGRDASSSSKVSSKSGSSKAAGSGAATVNLRVLDGEKVLLFETGPFTGVSSMDIDFERDVCFMLVDVEGKELATMWLHAAFLHEPSLVCDYRWWDVNRHHKGAKKLLKHCTIELLFHDRGEFAGAGRTLPPCTDKEFRLGRSLRTDELEVEEEEDGHDTEDEIEQAEGRFESSTRMHDGANDVRLEHLNDMLHAQRDIRSGGLIAEVSLLWRKIFSKSERGPRVAYRRNDNINSRLE